MLGVTADRGIFYYEEIAGFVIGTKEGYNSAGEPEKVNTKANNNLLPELANPSFVSFLDFTRWVAATVVFVGHLRNPLFVGFNDVTPENVNIFVIAWYFVTGWFGEAVIIFFVLSGYLVGGIGIAKLKASRFDLPNYTIDRFTRIYMAFFPALCLTAVFDFVGYTWFADAGLYSGEQAMIAEKVNREAFITTSTWELFFSNTFMLQTFITASFGSNGPLWTLSAEMWFYIMFGVAAFLVMAKTRLLKLAAAAVAIIITVILGLQFPVMFGLWLIGAAVPFLPRTVIANAYAAIIAFLGLLIIFRLYKDTFLTIPHYLEFRNYLVALFFGYLLYAMRFARFRILEYGSRPNRFLANFSFSLYLIHFPLMIFFLSVIHSVFAIEEIKTGFQPTSIMGLMIYVSIIFLIFVGAYLFAQLTEQNTFRVRKALRKRLLGR